MRAHAGRGHGGATSAVGGWPQATAPMTEGSYIADLIATLAMLDPILGGIDR